MFKNNLNPPQMSLSKCSNQMQQILMITMTADGTTMNVISWNHDFPSQNPF